MWGLCKEHSDVATVEFSRARIIYCIPQERSERRGSSGPEWAPGRGGDGTQLRTKISLCSSKTTFKIP